MIKTFVFPEGSVAGQQTIGLPGSITFEGVKDASHTVGQTVSLPHQRGKDCMNMIGHDAVSIQVVNLTIPVV